MSYVPQKITLEEVQTAARKAVEDGTIGFLNGMCKCVYEGSNGSRCAVGAAMTWDTLLHLRDHAAMGLGLTRLYVSEYVQSAPTEREEIIHIQMHHDDVCARLREGAAYTTILGAFLRRIGYDNDAVQEMLPELAARAKASYVAS